MNTQQTQPKNPFEENDANGDGSLNVAELGTFAEQMAEMTGQTVTAEELLAKLDTDQDGSVSEAELEAGRPEGPPLAPLAGTTQNLSPRFSLFIFLARIIHDARFRHRRGFQGEAVWSYCEPWMTKPMAEDGVASGEKHDGFQKYTL